MLSVTITKEKKKPRIPGFCISTEEKLLCLKDGDSSYWASQFSGQQSAYYILYKEPTRSNFGSIVY